MYTPTELSKDPAVNRELQRIAQSFANKGLKYKEVAVEPTKPRKGDSYVCDGTNWDPIGDGISQPVWFDGTTWLPLGGTGGGSGIGIDGGIPTTTFGGSSLDGGTP
jgi:hypothetical protein